MTSLRNTSRGMLVACLLALGCDEPASDDAGMTADAATRDGGTDGGSIPIDSGPEEDAAVDAGAPDDGGPADGGLDAGTIEEDAGTDAGGIDPDTIPPPRPIEPASSALTTSPTVRFRWALTAPATGARLEVCRDRACTDVRETLDVEGESTTTLVPPDPGASSRVFYFRLTGRAEGVLGTDQSPVWSFSVQGRVTVTASSTWGTTHDFDGDGLSEVLGGAPASSTVRLYRGRSPAGGAPTADTAFAAAPAVELGTAVFGAGDVNGDGFADVAIGTAADLLVYHGSLGGFGPSMTIAAADTTIAGVSPTPATVAAAGDVDRDGYADLVIGDPAMGRVLLHRGGPSGVQTSGTPLSRSEPGFGASVAGGCDVDGDGFADVIVGATDAALVLPGGAAGLGAPVELVAGLESGGFGAAVACAGDVNGDGFPDVVVGAPEGHAAFVYHGGASGISTIASGVLRKQPGAPAAGTTSHGEAFGKVVGAAGDVNGDGFGDVVVVAPDLFAGNSGFVGYAFVFLSDSTGVGMTSPATSTAHDRAFGASAGATDVNRPQIAHYVADVDGDGFGDLVTGTPDRGGAGSILVYLGSASMTGLPGTPAWDIAGSGLVGFGETLASLWARWTSPAG